MTEPVISPDGQWRWDGTTWQPNTQAAATDTTTAAAAAAADKAPTAAASAPVSTTPAANVNDIVSVHLDDATPEFFGLVVGTIDGSTEDYTDEDGTQKTRTLREAGVLVVRLPDPTFVPNTALRG